MRRSPYNHADFAVYLRLSRKGSVFISPFWCWGCRCDRAEAARILFTTSSHSGMDPSDRTYLARLVSADTGVAAADAERRVDEVAARAKQDT